VAAFAFVPDSEAAVRYSNGQEMELSIFQRWRSSRSKDSMPERELRAMMPRSRSNDRVSAE
jgi:hypothetical protein